MAITYEPIASVTLSSTATTITFSSIPATYSDLRLTFWQAVTGGYPQYTINGDTGTNYGFTDIRSNGNAVSQSYSNNSNPLYLNGNDTGDTYPWFYTLDFINYAGNTHKSWIAINSGDKNLYNGGGQMTSSINIWKNTSPITAISFYGATFGINTSATLYGIKKA
jgi:hypothetical protein